VSDDTASFFDDQTVEALAALTSGSPHDVARAVTLLESASAGNSAEAPRYLAALSAAGVGMPQDWERGLDWLATAAERGSISAQGQIKALAGPEWSPDGSKAWDRKSVV
jgi:TPR repeat protein